MGLGGWWSLAVLVPLLQDPKTAAHRSSVYALEYEDRAIAVWDRDILDLENG